MQLSFYTTDWCISSQNICEYWPASSQFADISMNWIMSTINVFIAPFNTIIGWIF